MKLKKIAAPILAAALTLSLAVPALAADKHPFTDVPTWAEAAVTYSFDNGYVNGTSATTYNSDGQITIVEFIKVMVQMSTTEEQRTAIMDKAGTTPEQATDWTYQYRTIGKEIGLYAGLAQYENDKGETKCTRAVMAHILVNTLKARGEDISDVDGFMVLASLSTFNDAEAIKNSPYVTDIGTAISLGLIGGDNNHNFLPDDYMNRASAAQIFLRLDNPNGERAEVLKKLQSSSTTNGSGTTSGGSTISPPVLDGNGNNVSTLEPITIDMRTPNVSHREPKAGDTVIRPDGTSVVLAVEPVTGILGFGQNVGAYLGTAGQNGNLIYENCWSMATRFDNPLAMGWYTKSTVAGQEYSYFWSGEWKQIKTKTGTPLLGTTAKDGAIDSTGLWRYNAECESWIWRGPDNV